MKNVKAGSFGTALLSDLVSILQAGIALSGMWEVTPWASSIMVALIAVYSQARH